MASRKRQRTDGDAEGGDAESKAGEGEEPPVPVAAGFERPLPPPPPPRGTVRTKALTRPDGSAFRFDNAGGLVFDRTGTGGYYATSERAIYRVSAAGVVTVLAGSEEEEGDRDGVGTAARFGCIEDLALSSDGSTLFVADCNNNKIRRVVVATGAVSTLAGSGEFGDVDGVGAAAQFKGAFGLALSSDDSTLFVADWDNLKIRQVDVTTGAVSTLAGSGEFGDVDGVGAAAQFKGAFGLALSSDDSTLFVADYHNNKIRQVDVTTGAVSTLAGSGQRGDVAGVGAAAQFNRPWGLALSSDDSMLFVADMENHKIRQVMLSTGAVSTLTGSGIEGCTDGLGTAAELCLPKALAVNNHVLLVSTYAADDSCLFVREVSLCPPMPRLQPPSPAIPASTFATDIGNMMGDKQLPHGTVTFVVGPQHKRVEAIPKNLLCVRSDFFRKMFRSGMRERDAEEVALPEEDPAAFASLLKYLGTDVVKIDTGSQHAFGVMLLARKYQVRRLELLCLQAVQGSVGAGNAVSLLEAAHHFDQPGLFSQCRRFIAKNGVAVKEAGGLEQLRDFGVTKGLLGDAMVECGRLADEIRGLKRRHRD